MNANYIKTESRVNAMKTRRRRGGTEHKDIIRARQIRAIQDARWRAVYAFGDRIGSNPGREHWAGPSEAKLGHMRSLVQENNRLLSKGKGRSRTRRN